MMKKLFVLLIVLSFAMSCSIRKEEHMTLYNLDEVKKEKTINLNVGETVQITAETNPSTGYSWKVTPAADCSVSLLNETNKRLSEEGIVGAPMRAIYTYKGDKVGTCVVEFDYNRAWEGPSKSPKKVKFVVK